MSHSNMILSIYKSRVNILDIMDVLDYEMDEYRSFSINEIDAMASTTQLDLLLNHRTENKKVYIKYYMDKKPQFNKTQLDNLLEELMVVESVLDKNDTLIIITLEEPNETIVNHIKYLYDRDGIFVVMHSIHRLQFNILSHNLVPKCNVLSKEDDTIFRDKYNIKRDEQLPEVSRFDPHMLAMCVRPGQICEFDRKSKTAMNTKYYRICI